MTETFTLELTLDELKELDKNLYYCEETWSICDKIRNAYPKSPVVEAYKDWYGEYPPTSPDADKRDIARWHGFQAGYNAPKEEKVRETAQERGERVHNEMEELVRESVENKNKDPLEWPTTPKPFMNNCIITGNPPNGYSSWSDWYNELGSKGILVNLRISSNECKPTLKSPEETEQSLKEAFVEAQQTEEWKELQRKIDEEDNDKNFKNSLDLIKEWGENNKPPTLKELLWEWWDDIFTTHSSRGMETSIDDLVSRIEAWLPEEHDTNSYKWNQCIRTIREKLR